MKNKNPIKIGKLTYNIVDKEKFLSYSSKICVRKKILGLKLSEEEKEEYKRLQKEEGIILAPVITEI